MRALTWIVVVLLAGCGSSGAFQDTCWSDTDCDDGGQCLATFTADGTSCMAGALACTRTCTTSAECVGYSTLGSCQYNCSTARVCF